MDNSIWSKECVIPMKSIKYIIGIVVLIIFSISIMLEDNKAVTNTDLKNPSGDVQNVIIGMKDYNYYPNTIEVEVGKPVSISLDSSVYGCFRDFTIREFGVRKYLKTPQDNVIFTPTNPGTYTFACSMGMGTGTLIVK